MNLLDKICKYENDLLDNEEVIDLFQRLIDNDDIWTLQGNYARIAKKLIDCGHITLNEKNLNFGD